MNKSLYWFLQVTWGILTFLAGALVTAFIRIFVRKSRTYKNGYGYITTVGKNWGGLSLGPFAFCGRYNEKNSGCYSPSWYDHTRKHEFGHSIQVLFMGPLFIFIVAIPSAIRYWYINFSKKGIHIKYDAIWFEGTATKWGAKWVEKIEAPKVDPETQVYDTMCTSCPNAKTCHEEATECDAYLEQVDKIKK